MWQHHLDRQYQDRMVYWNARAASRHGFDREGNRTLCLIRDSMDRSKFALPRTCALQGKEMAGLERPRLDCTTVLAHGHLVSIYFAEQPIIKGSSWTCEIVAHVLHSLTLQGLDLRDYEVVLQGDNCSKEIKSTAVLKYLAFMVSTRRIRRASLQTLVTGHSHEDIDQFFSLMGGYLETCKELHDPQQFQDAISEFVANRSVRSCEPSRMVVRVDQVRDWRHGFNLGMELVWFSLRNICYNF